MTLYRPFLIRGQILTLSLLSVMVCTGCAAAGSGLDADTAPVTENAPATQSSLSNDERYINSVRNNVDASAWADADLTSLGEDACGAMASGVKSLTSFAVTQVNDGKPAGLVMAAIGASAGAYCPEYAGTATEWANLLKNLN